MVTKIRSVMKTIINDMYDAFEKGNIPAVLAAMDDHIIWNEAEGNSLADGNLYKGPDAVANNSYATGISLQFDPPKNSFSNLPFYGSSMHLRPGPLG